MCRRSKIQTIICTVAFCLLGILNIQGQKLGSGDNESCDINKITIYSLGKIRFDMIGKPEKDYNMPFIIIARLGTNETSPRYNWQRLKETKEYLVNRVMIPNELVILSQGEKIKGKGRIDIYYDGVLQYTVFLKRNQYLNLVKGGHCDAG